ncbi:MAG: hypothetical protein SA339_06845 [Methanomassiliicoccus sp.]|nr:hypothetical protein [Methanomassiliicoccus sp.]
MKRWYEELRRGDHAAHIYRSDAEQVRVVTDTVSWMGEDQRLVMLSDRWDTETKASRPRVLDAAVEDGHLIVVPAKPLLCRSGQFQAGALQEYIDVELDGLTRPELVIMWDLDWLGADPDAFEAHIVQLSSMALAPPIHGVTLIGQYGTAFYTAEQVERILRVNPLVLEGGMLARKFWVVSKSSVGKPSKDGHSLRVDVPESAKVHEL